MSSDRLEILMKFFQNDPEDPFNRYALALEYMSLEEYEKAIGMFLDTINLDAAYVPAYQQLGILYTKLGNVGDASSILKAGIEQAKISGDIHAETEMRDMVDELNGDNVA